MIGELALRNRQRTRPVDLRLLRRITRCLLTDFMPAHQFELGLHLIASDEMARLNQSFLQHNGSTDVITFDYTTSYGPAVPGLNPVQTRGAGGTSLVSGEIFLSLDETVSQARRFRTTWQGELVRYLIHGVLHLCGYDDRRPAARRRMKREENRLLRELSRRFPLSALGRKRKLHP